MKIKKAIKLKQKKNEMTLPKRPCVLLIGKEDVEVEGEKKDVVMEGV